MKNLIIFLLIIMGALLFSLCIAILNGYIFYKIDKYSCHSVATIMKKQYRFGFYTGCLIKINNEWIPIQSYKVISGKLNKTNETQKTKL